MKKFKLFTTIASLCLAVALMAFGVYAATSASIGVTSSITFSADGQVGGTLTVKSYSVASVAESGEIDLSQQTALENFTAIINATDASGNVNASKGTGENAKFDTTNKYVVYSISFAETTNSNVTLKLESIVLKKGTTEIKDSDEEKSISVCRNDLTSASAAKDKTYYFAVKLNENLNATTEFTVQFNVVVAPAA